MNNWFSLDKKRKHKKQFIAIHLKNKSIRPSFSPEDSQKVFNIIWENFTQEGKKFV